STGIAGAMNGPGQEIGLTNEAQGPGQANQAPDPGQANKAPDPGQANEAPDPGQANDRRPAGGSDWGALLRRHFWMDDRFRDRLGSDDTSGEANVWPFHLGLVADGAMLTAALATLRREGYTAPYP